MCPIHHLPRVPLCSMRQHQRLTHQLQQQLPAPAQHRGQPSGCPAQQVRLPCQHSSLHTAMQNWRESALMQPWAAAGNSASTLPDRHASTARGRSSSSSCRQGFTWQALCAEVHYSVQCRLHVQHLLQAIMQTHAYPAPVTSSSCRQGVSGLALRGDVHCRSSAENAAYSAHVTSNTAAACFAGCISSSLKAALQLHACPAKTAGQQLHT